MTRDKKQTIFLFAIAALCLIISIVIFVISGQYAGFHRALLIVCGILLLVLAFLFVAYWALSRDNEPNFFLYNRRTRQNMPVEELTQQIVIDRMTFFLAQIADSPELLWTGNVLERTNNFGHKSVYKPLVCYKMLYDMGDKEPDSPYWEYLEIATDDVLRIICSTLEQVGERQIVRAFRMLLEAEPKPGPQMKDFLRRNVPYFAGKMYAYVKRHIDFFY